jgi:general secretion pathway protein N
MRVALAWFGADRAGVSAAEVSGSIWSGQLKGATYRGMPLGNVALSLDPITLAGGAQRLIVQGPLGRATLVRGSTHGFEMADAAIEVGHLEPSLPLAGLLRLERATLLFSGKSCVRADGRLATDVLQRAFNGPEVSGNLSCAGDAAVAQLEGRVQDVQVSIALRLDSGGRYQAETRIVSANPTIRTALPLAGFSENGDGFTRSDEGALGT